MFPSVFVCDSDIFQLNLFMTVEQQCITIAFIKGRGEISNDLSCSKKRFSLPKKMFKLQNFSLFFQSTVSYLKCIYDVYEDFFDLINFMYPFTFHSNYFLFVFCLFRLNDLHLNYFPVKKNSKVSYHQICIWCFIEHVDYLRTLSNVVRRKRG